MKDFIIKLFSTFFFAGYFPKAPGTFSSFLTIALIWFFVPENFVLLLTLAIILFAINILVAGRAEGIFGEDSKKIVSDESLGMIISLLSIQKSLLFYSLAFILFRGIDIIKPFPLRELEKLGGGWGVILDDVFAGFYTNLILHLFIIFY